MSHKKNPHDRPGGDTGKALGRNLYLIVAKIFATGIGEPFGRDRIEARANLEGELPTCALSIHATVKFSFIGV